MSAKTYKVYFELMTVGGSTRRTTYPVHAENPMNAATLGFGNLFTELSTILEAQVHPLGRMVITVDLMDEQAVGIYQGADVAKQSNLSIATLTRDLTRDEVYGEANENPTGTAFTEGQCFAVKRMEDGLVFCYINPPSEQGPVLAFAEKDLVVWPATKEQYETLVPSDDVPRKRNPNLAESNSDDYHRMKLALGILDGRIDIETLNSEQAWDALGWNPYEFNTTGRPTVDEVKEAAEEIVLRYLMG